MRWFWSYFICFILASTGWCSDLRKLYPPGQGSKFKLSLQGVPVDVSVYVTESSQEMVGIESYLTSRPMGLPLELWQQTRLLNTAKGITVKDAFFLAQGLPKPERIPPDQIKSNGWDLKQFILQDRKSIEPFRIGDEKVVVPAGTVAATHYRKKEGGQVVDFWISDDSKPLGLVKLVVTGKQPFDLALASLLKNVQRKIDPNQAVAMTTQGRALMGLAGVRVP